MVNRDRSRRKQAGGAAKKNQQQQQQVAWQQHPPVRCQSGRHRAGSAAACLHRTRQKAQAAEREEVKNVMMPRADRVGRPPARVRGLRQLLSRYASSRLLPRNNGNLHSNIDDLDASWLLLMRLRACRPPCMPLPVSSQKTQTAKSMLGLVSSRLLKKEKIIVVPLLGRVQKGFLLSTS